MNAGSRSIRLYRGISVRPDEAEEVAELILSEGIQFSEKTRWRTTVPHPRDVRSAASTLRKTPVEIRKRTDEMTQWKMACACGDPYGASYYALRHNRSGDRTNPVVIEFEANVDQLAVDGKDFLYTAFQLWDQFGTKTQKEVEESLQKLFGKAILPYFREAAAHSEPAARIGLCDLACYDSEVVFAHSKNKVLIRGRHNTEFCSAFQVCLPVPSSALISVNARPEWPAIPKHSTCLNDVRGS